MSKREERLRRLAGCLKVRVPFLRIRTSGGNSSFLPQPGARAGPGRLPYLRSLPLPPTTVHAAWSFSSTTQLVSSLLVKTLASLLFVTFCSCASSYLSTHHHTTVDKQLLTTLLFLLSLFSSPLPASRSLRLERKRQSVHSHLDAHEITQHRSPFLLTPHLPTLRHVVTWCFPHVVSNGNRVVYW